MGPSTAVMCDSVLNIDIIYLAIIEKIDISHPLCLCVISCKCLKRHSFMG